MISACEGKNKENGPTNVVRMRGRGPAKRKVMCKVKGINPLSSSLASQKNVSRANKNLNPALSAMAD